MLLSFNPSYLHPQSMVHFHAEVTEYLGHFPKHYPLRENNLSAIKEEIEKLHEHNKVRIVK